MREIVEMLKCGSIDMKNVFMRAYNIIKILHRYLFGAEVYIYSYPYNMKDNIHRIKKAKRKEDLMYIFVYDFKVCCLYVTDYTRPQGIYDAEHSALKRDVLFLYLKHMYQNTLIEINKEIKLYRKYTKHKKSAHKLAKPERILITQELSV